MKPRKSRQSTPHDPFEHVPSGQIIGRAAHTSSIDLRPIAFVTGRILLVLAIMMLIPAFLDMQDEVPDDAAFLQSAILTGFVGILLSLATGDATRRALDARQAYLLTFATWVFVPMFGALPFWFGPPHLGFTDAYFETVSGMTTTGASVIIGLDDLPPGINLWRGILNWLGGLGIVFVAMIFLPILRVGGMQFFRAEAFETFGKVLPRAADIAWGLVVVYVALSVASIIAFRMVGLSGLDATVVGAAAMASGGFTPSDLSFDKYPPAAEYVGTFFMLLSAMPFIHYVQMMNGKSRPLRRDPQVRAFLFWLGIAVVLVTMWRLNTSSSSLPQAFRETLFNLASVMTGTGFQSGHFATWEGFAMVMSFVLGLIGGCSGSSSGALTVFRVQLTLQALARQIRLIQSPHLVEPVKYAGRPVDNDVIDALILYVTGFILTMGVMSVAMTLTGVDVVSSLFAIWTSLCNIGYAFGPMTAATNTFTDFPEMAKWLMIIAMILGRLGLLTMLVLVLPRFWQR